MAFRDFIPETDPEADSYGQSGYQDYVPPKKPVKHEDVKDEPAQVPAKAKKE
jgi:hypothetical protein